MPLYKVYTKKHYRGYEWGNTYHVTAETEAAAAAIAQQIVTLERAATWVDVAFDGYRISTAAIDGRLGRTYGLALVGQVVIANVMPIEVCGRIDLLPGFRQPNRKYYHFVMGGAEQVAGELNTTPFNRLTTLANGLVALAGLVDRMAGDFSSHVVNTRVATHQMYRAWAARPGVEAGD